MSWELEEVDLNLQQFSDIEYTFSRPLKQQANL